MNEVKKSDIALVIESLGQYLEHIKQIGTVDLKEFVRFMEPVFSAAGYRDSVGGYDSCNILIIHDSGAGDFITQSGTIREIRRLYPTAHITLIVFPNAFQLAECCPYVDEVFVNPRPDHFNHHFEESYEWNMEFAKLLLLKRFDICYSFTCLSGTPTLMYMSGAQTRISHHLMKENAMEITDIPIKYTLKYLATHIIPPYKFVNHVVDANFSFVD